jgi:hypothetical protein
MSLKKTLLPSAIKILITFKRYRYVYAFKKLLKLLFKNARL